jgi:hypothetical protein
MPTTRLAVTTESDTAPGRLRWLIDAVATTADRELDCDAVLTLLPRFLEHRRDTRSKSRVMSGVLLHLRHCRACAEVYEALTSLLELEETGALPALDDAWADLRDAVSAALPSRPPHRNLSDLTEGGASAYA